MYYNLCRAYRGPGGTMKENKASNISKSVIREHEGAQFILYHYNIKG